MMFDPEDRFRDSRAKFSTYPANLLTTRYSRRKLTSYNQTLEKERPRLFNDNRDSVKVIELDNGHGLQDFEASNQAELESLFQRGMEDPLLRYIAIEAPSSRKPLGCSHAMFTYLSSFHQISPSFIPAVCSFGMMVEPKDVCLAYFNADDSLAVPPSDQMTIRSLGRSGFGFQMSYLLRVVESSKSRPPWNFIVRPLAVYHSYDVQTGRTVWVTVKGNSDTREQICDVLEDQLHSGSISGCDTPIRSFIATLAIHLSILETVDENWQLYINEIDHEAREAVDKASNGQLDIGPRFEQLQDEIKQQMTQTDTNKISKERRQSSFLQSVKSGFQRNFSKRKLDQHGADPTQPKNKDPWWKDFFTGPSPTTLPNKENEIQEKLDKYLRLDHYSFSDNQKLHRYGEAIQEAILTIKLDVNVVHGLRDFYERERLHSSVFKDENHPDLYRLETFVDGLKSLENSLCIKHQQLENLEKFVKEAKVLYDGVSQYRNVQISTIYAQSAQASAKRMEEIAGITEKETASMHIITLVTLVFLPGTFIASFLQSGVFQWKDQASLENAWLFRIPVFEMFIAICLVMMFLTFVVWFFVFRCLRGRSHQGQATTVGEKDGSEMV
ncbi:hypothetical protein KJ359_011784 [Pestalotiopsis sp. 9143b]|nr:hypothetical protein KJ359_011784 [Pestalotiopsis sp. 9143b]